MTLFGLHLAGPNDHLLAEMDQPVFVAGRHRVRQPTQFYREPV